jgi:hypothetical protein
MQSLKLKLMLLLTLFLSVSCNDFPVITPQERCVVVLESDVGQYCRCHMYQWTEGNIGRITPSVDHEIMYCNKLIGFSPDSTGAIYLWQEKVRLWLIRNKR